MTPTHRNLARIAAANGCAWAAHNTPPTDAYLDAWMARWRKQEVRSVTWNCSELPADVAAFLKEM